MNLLTRLIQNPKTTIGGTATGALMLAAGGTVLSQAGCDFSQVQWAAILGMLFAGPAAVGGLATDNGKNVTP